MLLAQMPFCSLRFGKEVLLYLCNGVGTKVSNSAVSNIVLMLLLLQLTPLLITNDAQFKEMLECCWISHPVCLIANLECVSGETVHAVHDTALFLLWLYMAAAFSDTPMLLLFSETWFQELPKHLSSQCYYPPLQHSVSFNCLCKHVCVCVCVCCKYSILAVVGEKDGEGVLLVSIIFS